MSKNKFDEKEYKKNWNKTNMKQVKADYKTEFVEEFKQACNKLGITQSMIIRKAMEDTIMEAEKVTKRWFVEDGYYGYMDENSNVQALEPCDGLTLFENEDEAREYFNKEKFHEPKGYLCLGYVLLNKDYNGDNYLSAPNYDCIVTTESIEYRYN